MPIFGLVKKSRLRKFVSRVQIANRMQMRMQMRVQMRVRIECEMRVLMRMRTNDPGSFDVPTIENRNRSLTYKDLKT